jgi:hypothetical protein
VRQAQSIVYCLINRQVIEGTTTTNAAMSITPVHQHGWGIPKWLYTMSELVSDEKQRK